METRSRKRAEASSSSQQKSPSTTSVNTRSSKKARVSSTSAVVSDPAVSIRSRLRSNSNNTSNQIPMDLHDSPVPKKESDGTGRRRRSNRDKGKEKEEVEGSRSRDMETEKRDAMGTSAADNDNDNDNNSEDGAGAGLLHHNFTSASSALQGLLRKLGAGLDDLLPSSALSGSSGSHQSSRLKKMLAGLRADGEEGKQVEALTQLCDMLSIGTEDSLGSFSVDSFVPVLVGLLNHESNPDIMLLAARALTHLCDVLPSLCSAVVHYGAVTCFVARLLTIEYMDLAEQSLQAIKKISQEHPTACLRAGALMAVLSYLDFFSTGVQRVALSTAANMCKKLPSDAADFVMEAVPLLTNLLNYHDSKVLDHASVCLTRIAEAFASSPDKLDELCNHGLVAQAAGLISTSNSGGGQASLSTPTCTGLIRLLSTCASGSALGAKTLHLLGISTILKDILSGSSLVSNNSISPALTRPAEQIFEIMNLADELLPPLPEGTISLPVNLTFVKGSSVKKSSPCIVENPNDATDAVKNVISAREKLIHDQPELLRQFGMDLLPVLIQIYTSSVNGTVRHKCLSVIAKLMYFSKADMIQSLLSVSNISSFLAGILAWKDPQVLVPALQIAEVLMEKLPGTFSKIFIREGVVHAVDMLILPNSSCSSSSNQSSAEKDNDFLIGSSRSRRYRRRSGGLNPEVGSIEESKRAPQGAMVSSSASVETPTSNSSLRVTVSTQAKTFKSKYFPSGPGVIQVGASEDLIHLKNLCGKLNATAEDVKLKCKGKSKAFGNRSFSISPDTEKHLSVVISEIIKELTKDGISTFEFICSGVVSSLLNYLSCGTFSKERVSEANLPKLRDHAIQRYKSFLNVSLTQNKEGAEIPMTVLVQKLQSALSSSERFPVVLSHSSRSTTGSARLSSGLSVLSQPIKLCLCRARGDKSLRDYSSNVVLIDPFATLAAVEEFLWPRVVRGESGQKTSESAENSEHGTTPAGSGASLSTVSPTGRRHSTRSRSALLLGDGSKNEPKEGHPNHSKGKGKAVLKSAINEEPKGLQTRNSTRTKAASDKNEPDSGKIDTSSEDEDLEMSPVDVDDALVIEEEEMSEDEDDDHDGVLGDDSIPVCPDKVHDVKLGDAVDEGIVASSTSNNQTHLSTGSSNRTIIARGTDSDDFKTGNIFSSRGAMSFAAAAMAGLASGSGRGLRGSRDRRAIPRTGSSNDPPKLVFSSGGKTLNRQLTIYQAIQRQLNFDADDENERVNGSDFLAGDGTRLWGDIYTITYQKADAHHDQSSLGGSSLLHKSSKSSVISKPAIETQNQQMPLMDSILQGELPCDLEKTNSTYNILALLRVLECLNQLASRLRFLSLSDDFSAGRISNLNYVSTSDVKVPTEEFVNSKLTPKLTRQMQDALALCSGSLPSWCSQLTKACPFLFPFETRRQFFYSTAFGLSRALHRLQQQGAENHSSANEREIRVGRLQRQKVRVSRNQILDSAAKVMEMYSSNKAMLEVEYFGEVGTGLGPTLEFYTLLSHEFQKVPLQMWRCNSSNEESAMQSNIDEHTEFNRNDTVQKEKIGVDSSNDFVSTSLGLFPRPWPPNADSSQFKKVVEYFRLIGRVMAKALQDGRLLDIPLSISFYKLFLGQDLDLHDIYYFDAEFGKTLQEMQLLVDRKKFIDGLDSSNIDSVHDLDFRGISIEDLCLDFTLPGYPEYVLKEGEDMVNIHNLNEYISLVVDATLKSGISRQMDAFREGFNQGFDITSLQIFSPDELDCLLCGRRELWETEALVDHIKFDHGYTAKSPAITNFLEIMNELTPDQQRAFCQFVTGAPRLPPGGLAVLNPKLTIVRKLSSTATNIASNGGVISELADNDLPSVMTCANYLKLPPYSTKEIMLKKLLFAINEGQGSFDLS